MGSGATEAEAYSPRFQLPRPGFSAFKASAAFTFLVLFEVGAVALKRRVRGQAEKV